MKENKDLHSFHNDQVNVVYHPETMRFYRLTGDQLPEIPQETGSPAAVDPDTPTSLERLVFITTTQCNLRCRYCYAEGGDYGLGYQKMSPETALKTLDWVYSLIPTIETIQFFGGEPTLNPEVISAVCERLTQQHAAGELAVLPRLGMVTNGTQLTPELEALFQRYHIHLTFSIDGPEPAHDINRVFVNQKGSYAVVQEHYHQLRAAGVSLAVEMTYTPQARAAGYTIWDLAQFTRTELNQRDPHLVPVQTPPNTPFSWEGQIDPVTADYRQASRAALQSLLDGENFTGFSLLSNVLRGLVTRRPHSAICPAGTGTLAVDPDGNLTPCFMFAGEKEFSLGNIHQPPTRKEFLEKVTPFIQANAKSNHTDCPNCWARRLCTGCLGEIWFEQRDLTRESPLMCAITKAIAEETMLFLAELQSQPESWRRFVQNYRAHRLDQPDTLRNVI